MDLFDFPEVKHFFLPVCGWANYRLLKLRHRLSILICSGLLATFDSHRLFDMLLSRYLASVREHRVILVYRGAPLFISRVLLLLGLLLWVVRGACSEVSEIVRMALLRDILQLKSDCHWWSPLYCILAHFILWCHDVFLLVNLGLVGLQFV